MTIAFLQVKPTHQYIYQQIKTQEASNKPSDVPIAINLFQRHASVGHDSQTIHTAGCMRASDKKTKRIQWDWQATINSDFSWIVIKNMLHMQPSLFVFSTTLRSREYVAVENHIPTKFYLNH